MAFYNPTSLVYLVDDEYPIRDSLTLLIESTGQPIKSFDSAEAFLKAYDPEQSGCLVLDVRMPVMSGLELQEELVARGVTLPIIFISGHAKIPDSAKAFRAGAIDFLEKPFENIVLLERIQESIRKDLENREKLIEKRKLQSRIDCLTPREKEVLLLIVSSHSNKESAKKLSISSRTIDVHRARIMQKMQAENLAELVVMAMHCDVLHY